MASPPLFYKKPNEKDIKDLSKKQKGAGTADFYCLTIPTPLQLTPFPVRYFDMIYFTIQAKLLQFP